VVTARQAQIEARVRRLGAALTARETMSAPGPAPERLRIATWNVNSLRVRLPGVARLLTRTAADVLCLQETKAGQLSAEATAAFDGLGYRAVHAGAGGYNGVAIVSRHPLDAVEAAGAFGDEHLDREPRLISCMVHASVPVRVATVYVPHGREIGHWHYDYKLAFLVALRRQVERWLAEWPHLVVCGDVNVAPTDSDVFHPDAFVGITHVTAAEREALADLLRAGLVDVDVARWGAAARRFTWWQNGLAYERNLGMRIDLLAASARLAAHVDTTWIDHVERAAARPSDHAAVVADFDVDLLTRGQAADAPRE
jgi:exodeoxyribonuclease-3